VGIIPTKIGVYYLFFILQDRPRRFSWIFFSAYDFVGDRTARKRKHANGGIPRDDLDALEEIAVRTKCSRFAIRIDLQGDLDPRTAQPEQPRSDKENPRRRKYFPRKDIELRGVENQPERMLDNARAEWDHRGSWRVKNRCQSLISGLALTRLLIRRCHQKGRDST